LSGEFALHLNPGLFEPGIFIALKFTERLAEYGFIPRDMLKINLHNFSAISPPNYLGRAANGLILLGCLIGCGSHYSAFEPQDSDRTTVAVALLDAMTGSEILFTGAVEDCRSGYRVEFDAQQSIETHLIIGDHNCRVVIEKIEMDHVQYFVAENLGYRSESGSENIFEASDGSSLIVVPRSELPNPVTDSNIRIDLEIEQLTEGQSISRVASADDLIARPGMVAWFGTIGRFVIDRDGGVSRWRSELGLKSRLVQSNKSHRPAYRAGYGSEFVDAEDSLIMDYAKTSGATSHEMSILMDAGWMDSARTGPQVIASFGAANQSDLISLVLIDRHLSLWGNGEVLLELGSVKLVDRKRILVALSSGGINIQIGEDVVSCFALICQGRSLANFGAQFDRKSRLVMPSFRGYLAQVVVWKRQLEDFEIDLMLGLP
jgi:hypothetical protein